MKSVYNNLTDALFDIENDIISKKKENLQIITNEYVRTTTDTSGIVPYQHGTLRNSLIKDSEYDKGIVQSYVPYAGVRNESNITGVKNYISYEWDNNKEYYAEVYAQLLYKDLGRN
ncbi:MAG: hypothetical protein ACK5HS_04530 [Mycoplasmatales bacterium]